MLEIEITIEAGVQKIYQMVAHAYEQMIEDDVSLAHIQQALLEAEQEISQNSDNFIYRFKVAQNKAIAVVVSNDERRIVTVYYYNIKDE